MSRNHLRHAVILGVGLVPITLAFGQMLAGCSDTPSVMGQGGAASSSSSTTGAGGEGGAGASSSGAGMGGAGMGGASSSSSGMFIDDAGPKSCPVVPGAAEMVAVPGWNGDSYCVDKTEVTNAQYATWLETSPDINGQISLCASNASFEPATGIPPKDDYPVGWVDWCDAFAYCKAVGKRLCGRIGGGPAPYYAHDDASRDQWFNACSHGGTQGYPYGQAYDANACNVKDAAFGAVVSVATLPSCEGGFAGLFDMSGNVWEWEDACIPSDAGADICRRRGGSFSSSALNVDCATPSSRPRDAAEANTGFRCCAD